MKRFGIFIFTILCLICISCNNTSTIDLTDDESSCDSEEISVEEDTQNASVYIHICGAVENPGVYRLDEGSRIYEAVETAGGFLPDADTQSLNLARVLRDGEQLTIAYVGEKAEQDDRVDINSADVEQLTKIPGIGETRANAILSYREKNGPFLTTEDLMNVSGIKQGLYERILPYIYVK